MDYQDVEQVWQQRVAQQAARYESEIVALTLQMSEKFKQLEAENERLKDELVQNNEGSGAATPSEPTS